MKKTEHDLKRSRNARLSQAIRAMSDLQEAIAEFRALDEPACFEDMREHAATIIQCVHEASAYDNCFRPNRAAAAATEATDAETE